MVYLLTLLTAFNISATIIPMPVPVNNSGSAGSMVVSDRIYVRVDTDAPDTVIKELDDAGVVILENVYKEGYLSIEVRDHQYKNIKDTLRGKYNVSIDYEKIENYNKSVMIKLWVFTFISGLFMLAVVAYALNRVTK